MITQSDMMNHCKSWPFEIARNIYNSIDKKLPRKGYVLFCTGYGPSGLPHIGTYCEVVRTRIVQHAFEQFTNMPTKLMVISDDMDGLRKVPTNIPNASLLKDHIQKPLTMVPDPFRKEKSYGDYMNKKCREFLDNFNIQYEFCSATEMYKSGHYDSFLIKVLEKYESIMEIMLPSLGEERKKTYSPFLPICPKKDIVLYVPIIERNLKEGTISYIDEDSQEKVTLPVTGGHCKLQWKPDFGMRWAALDVDFEMYGKDHLANSKIYTSICRVIGGKSPSQFFFELFLDENGKKISKSSGNGVSTEEWLRYAPIESLSLYIYQAPRKAKRLYFDVIPKNVDEYITFLNKFHLSTEEEKLENPVWHIHYGKVPKHNLYGLSFSLLLNLACACNPENKNVLWGFIQKYAKDATPESAEFLDKLSMYAVKYYEDFIKPNKKYRVPLEDDIILLNKIRSELEVHNCESTAEEIQKIFYNIGKDSGYDNLREFFKMIYEVLLGQTQGPRLGSFVKLYGIDKTIQMIDLVLDKTK